jgi:metal-sulfur cluster biosynthetic enzyme
MATADEVRESLKQVVDPEIGVNIVDLGLVYGVDVDDKEKKCHVRMTLTSQACPIGPQLVASVSHIAKQVTGFKDVKVEVVWTPPWDPRVHASEDGKFMLGLM